MNATRWNALRIFALLYWHFTLLVRDNATVIIVVDELLDLIGLQGIYQCLDLRQILVAFLNSDYIYISSGSLSYSRASSATVRPASIA